MVTQELADLLAISYQRGLVTKRKSGSEFDINHEEEKENVEGDTLVKWDKFQTLWSVYKMLCRDENQHFEQITALVKHGSDSIMLWECLQLRILQQPNIVPLLQLTYFSWTYKKYS